MTSIRKGDSDLHYGDGSHRGTPIRRPPTTDGRALERYERRIRAHLAEHSRRVATGEEFPMDWSEWRPLWRDWSRRHEIAGRFIRTSYRFPAKSFMADEILGVWRVGYRNVELSEVTFLGMRGVGITYGEGSGTTVPADGVVHSFRELETVLARDCGITFDNEESER